MKHIAGTVRSQVTPRKALNIQSLDTPAVLAAGIRITRAISGACTATSSFAALGKFNKTVMSVSQWVLGHQMVPQSGDTKV